ncbi:MAG: hypothetical protein IT327_29840 [Anaerolineae bacterium]|nr:hypothetical protein [Anaerolineae bacterium]
MLRLFWQNIRAMVMNRRREGGGRQTAVAAAYRQFVAEQPVWANSLFDACFLTCRAGELFAEERLPSPLVLAALWRSQFNVGSAAQKRADIHKLVPEMRAFLALVAEKSSFAGQEVAPEELPPVDKARDPFFKAHQEDADE